MLKGSCACGKIEYEIEGELSGPVTYCHCWRCRKHSGSSFGTTAGLRSQQLQFKTGEELLSSWESSPGTQRYFASCCGSPIFKTEADAEFIGFRLGTLDCDPCVKVEQHYMVNAVAPWVSLDDGLPKNSGADGSFGDYE